MKLKNKVAIVTGGASGMGLATAILFAKEGAKVVVADVNAEGCKETVNIIKGFGGGALVAKTDVSKEADVERLINTAVVNYGSLDIIFNNAGTRGKQVVITELPMEEWERIIAINLRGVFLGMKFAVSQMLKQGSGVIINTASTAGLAGYSGLSAYCASKGGVVSMTRAVAMELASKSIRVNCICPGPILTQMTQDVIQATPDPAQRRKSYDDVVPMLRMGTPEEISSVALFLASDDSSFMTGAILPVDGGVTAR